MVKDTDGLENVANDPGLAWEVSWVTEDLLSLGGEGHLLRSSPLSGGFDANSLLAIVDDLVKFGA